MEPSSVGEPRNGFECVHVGIYTPVCHPFQYQSFKEGAGKISITEMKTDRQMWDRREVDMDIPV